MITCSTGIDSAPYFVAIADFNNDNQSDVVVTNSNSDNIAIFLGFSNGTFAIAAIYSTGASSRPYGVAIGDLNNDNILDIIIADSSSSTILIFYGYGNGSFSHPITYSTGYDSFPFSVVAGDFNNDTQ